MPYQELAKTDLGMCSRTLLYEELVRIILFFELGLPAESIEKTRTSTSITKTFQIFWIEPKIFSKLGDQFVRSWLDDIVDPLVGPIHHRRYADST